MKDERLRIDVSTKANADISEGIIEIYRQSYGDYPYSIRDEEVRRFADVIWPGLTCQRGFLLVVGWMENQPVAMAYGVASNPENEITRRLAAQLGSAADDWLPHSFQVMDLAVRPPYRSQGIGGAVHDALLGHADCRTALLYTLAGANPASSFYASRGWSVLRERVRQFSENEYVLLGKRLGNYQR